MHSYLIITSDQTQALAKAQTLTSIPLQPKNPDFLKLTTITSIGIDEVRQIRAFLKLKPYQYESRVVYIETAHLLTIPAQNALLKMLEEPTENTLFILVAPSKNLLLPTILSRCQLIHLAPTQEGQGSPTPPEILDLIKSLEESSPAQVISASQAYAKNRPTATAVCDQLLTHFHRQLHLDPSPTTVNRLKATQTALVRLKANVDIRLTLDNLFFSFQRAS